MKTPGLDSSRSWAWFDKIVAPVGQAVMRGWMTRRWHPSGGPPLPRSGGPPLLPVPTSQRTAPLQAAVRVQLAGALPVRRQAGTRASSASAERARPTIIGARPHHAPTPPVNHPRELSLSRGGVSNSSALQMLQGGAPCEEAPWNSSRHQGEMKGESHTYRSQHVLLHRNIGQLQPALSLAVLVAPVCRHSIRQAGRSGSLRCVRASHLRTGPAEEVGML